MASTDAAGWSGLRDIDRVATIDRSETGSTPALPLRVHVTGNAGSGKTTAALRIGELLSLSVYHMDAIVWRPGWRKTPASERKRLESEMIRRQAWVIDGVSQQIRASADLVVVLDLPALRCLRRALRRSLSYLFGSRPGLPEKCPEILIIPRLIRMILRYPRLVGAAVREEAAESRNYVLIKSNEELQSLYRELVCRLR
jgi:adenylate kinase family enzyme